MPRTSRPITVTLGEIQKRVEEAFADPRQNLPAREVFKPPRSPRQAGLGEAE